MGMVFCVTSHNYSTGTLLSTCAYNSTGRNYVLISKDVIKVMSVKTNLCVSEFHHSIHRQSTVQNNYNEVHNGGTPCRFLSCSSVTLISRMNLLWGNLWTTLTLRLARMISNIITSTISEV